MGVREGRAHRREVAVTITYLTGCDTVEGRALAAEGLNLGALVQPSCNYDVTAYGDNGWAADNGCFTSKAFCAERWWAWLTSLDLTGCRFATALDVVGDHDATVARSAEWLPRIRTLGIPAAFVGQNGATVDTVPWDDFDVLFLGGSPECLTCEWVRPATDFGTTHCPAGHALTEWKLGVVARELTAEATRRGKATHMGRVNSIKRLVYAQSIGCATADGTWLAFGSRANAPRLRTALRTTAATPPTLDLAA